MGQEDGRRRVTGHQKKNYTRMFVNGKYVPKSHPLYRAGNYKSWDDAWSHNEIERTTEGDVYIITNPAFKGWCKVGKAVDAEDRVKGYQTGSPHRDYTVNFKIRVRNRHATEKQAHQALRRKAKNTVNEWFQIDSESASNIIQNLPECN